MNQHQIEEAPPELTPAARRNRINTASDFYKDVFGVRPRHYPAGDDGALQAYADAQKEFDRRKSTPQGRQQLREDGWRIDEPAE